VVVQLGVLELKGVGWRLEEGWMMEINLDEGLGFWVLHRGSP
jgi:hypothetical protein